ncbi:PP2C family protein-serine/threonine phosphatase [Microlunatus speluncae]|uniref:PP2C family protein-serine/threonine phosphatase n=1 Tax=Microlunatus speluncae TaxID=2594267 RepID=UPI0012664502|nr:protein phosphatase 2C domain-containing protein [Microlunatus speluncae]
MTDESADSTAESARRAKTPTDGAESDRPTETIMLPELAAEETEPVEATPPAGALGLRFVAHSEIGLIRKNNQDSGYASPRLLLVADGMGGAAAGDLASAIAVDAVRHVDTEIESASQLAELAAAIRKANDRISDFVADDFALEGMGTTVTGALFDGQTLALAHIGDSRAYLFRDGELERLTHDHSWVQSLVDEGKISEEEAAVHPHRSLLVKVLNGQPAADPDLTTVPLQLGDRLLFCSDGLCGLVEDDQIAAAMAEADLTAGMDRMVGEALAEGGIDNITVIFAEVVDSDPTDQVMILGAADEREIPAVPPRPDRADRDFGDEDDLDDPATAGAEAADDGDDEARYAPQAPGRARLLRPVLGLLVLAVIIAGAVWAGYAWTRTQFFVGASDDQVAIFQGLPDPMPGLSLSDVYEVQPLALSALPSAYQEQVRATIEVADLKAARETVARLTEAATKGGNGEPGPSATPPPSSSPPPSSAPPASPPPASKTPCVPASKSPKPPGPTC